MAARQVGPSVRYPRPMLPLVAVAAFAWDTHSLVTDRALARPDVALPDAVPVEPIEALLAAPGLAAVFDGFDTWEFDRGSTRYAATTLTEPTWSGFLAATRLNAKAPLPYVQVLLPDVPHPGGELGIRDVSAVVDPMVPLDMVYVPAGPTMSARAILDTYCDEPDWGMDRELFAIPAYGYGEQPYGRATGDSSIAPFHLEFDHENGLVRAFAPQLTEGMAKDRVELFVRLSRFAFASGHPYWGWRFAAWATHYVEDLAQPYHSKALPSVGGGYYWRYVVSPAKTRMQEKATQWATNRHGLYEGFVSWELQQSYLDDDPARDALAARLSGGDATWGAKDGTALVDAVTTEAADHARVIDETIAKAFGKHRTSDWRYDLATDGDYRADKVLPPPELAVKLVDETGRDFENAGRAARNVLALVQAP
jgi:hypothetical protein